MYKKLCRMIKQAIVASSRSDAGDFPVMQASYNGKLTKATQLNPYGFCSNPPPQSLGVLFEIQGREGVKYGIFDRTSQRFKNLSSGEVQVGNYLASCSIKFSSNGNVTITSPADVTVNASGSVTVSAGEDVTVTAGNDVSITASEDISISAKNMSMTITDTTSITIGGMSMSVTSSGLEITNGDVIADGISLKNHLHSGVTTGGSNTGGPV